ncbi:MAG: HNH endonuclease [Aeriscardovia sp.]|nr:HNH endonuclease [Aeriscardovia sp.]
MASDLALLLQANGVDEKRFEEAVHTMLINTTFAAFADAVEQAGKMREIRGLWRNNRTQESWSRMLGRLVQQYTNARLNEPELDRMTQLVEAWITASEYKERGTGNARIRAELLAKQHNLCAICHQPITDAGAELDHIVPYKYVGDELADSNFQMLCRSCNRHKSSNLDYAVSSVLFHQQS